MTRGKKLFALFGVLVVLMASLCVVTRLNAEDEEAEPAEAVVTVDTAAVTELSWQYGDVAYQYVKNDSGWVDPADDTFPVSPTAMDTLLAAINGMIPEKTIADVTDLAEYGLEAPACTIYVQGDEEYSISIGGESAMGSYRYVTLDGTTVHMVDDSILGSFQVERYAMLRQESVPVLNNVTSVTIERKNEIIQLWYENEEWHSLEVDEETLLDTDLVKGFMDDISTLDWSYTVTHNATEKQLKEYGLKKPAAVLTVEYAEKSQKPTDLTDSDGNAIMETITEEKTFVLELGNVTEEGVYARLQGSNMVYEIYESYSYEIMNISVENLISIAEE